MKSKSNIAALGCFLLWPFASQAHESMAALQHSGGLRQIYFEILHALLHIPGDAAAIVLLLSTATVQVLKKPRITAKPLPAQTRSKAE